MNLRYLYLLFCVLGLVLPYSQFVPWVIEHGINVALLVHELFANRISAFFGLDVIVSAIVLISFASSEGARLGMRNIWLPIIAVCLVGVSLGLPLFLYLRQSYLERPR
jgi:Terpene cyclase DEP1